MNPEAHLPSDSRRRLREVLAAWQDAVRATLHRPGCSCCGSGPVRLDPLYLADDIDHALRARYVGIGNAQFAAAWKAARAIGGPDFVRSLTALDDADDHWAAERVLDDVLAMLRSIGAAR